MFLCFNFHITLIVLIFCKIKNAKNTAQAFEISTTDRPQNEGLTNIYEKIGEHNYRFTEIEKQITQIRNTLENKQGYLYQKIGELSYRLGTVETKIADLEKSILNDSWRKNCKEVMQKQNSISGIYLIKPKSKIFKVFCDMSTEGGGWTVFQNRFDGSQNFFLNWIDYKYGFGDFSGEFWLGLDHLHELIGKNFFPSNLHYIVLGEIDNELYVELTDFDNKTVYAHYENFRVGNEEEGYVLKTLAGYRGDAGDSLFYHLGMKFSTKDRDQDPHPVHCAQRYTGAWWYNGCLSSNLNGRYLKKLLVGTDDNSAIVWSTFRGGLYGLKTSRMMIRPR